MIRVGIGMGLPLLSLIAVPLRRIDHAGTPVGFGARGLRMRGVLSSALIGLVTSALGTGVRWRLAARFDMSFGGGVGWNAFTGGLGW